MLPQRLAWISLFGWIMAVFTLSATARAEDLRARGGDPDPHAWAIEQSVFKDWQLSCSHQPGGLSPTCSMTTTTTTRNGGKVLLALQGINEESGALLIRLVFPFRTNNEVAMRMQIGRLSFEPSLDAGTIVSSNSFADGREVFFQMMRSESRATLYGDFETLGPLELVFSLAGFSAAADAWNDRLAGKVHLTPPFSDAGLFGPLTTSNAVSDFVHCSHTATLDWVAACERLLAIPSLSTQEQVAALSVALKINVLLDARESLNDPEIDAFRIQMIDLVQRGIDLDPRNPQMIEHLFRLQGKDNEGVQSLEALTGYWFGLFDPDLVTHRALYRFSALDHSIYRWITDPNNLGWPSGRFKLDPWVVCDDAINALDRGGMTWDVLVQQHPAAGFAALSGESEASCRNLVAESSEGAVLGAVYYAASPEVRASALSKESPH